MLGVTLLPVITLYLNSLWFLTMSEDHCAARYVSVAVVDRAGVGSSIPSLQT